MISKQSMIWLEKGTQKLKSEKWLSLRIKIKMVSLIGKNSKALS